MTILCTALETISDLFMLIIVLFTVKRLIIDANISCIISKKRILISMVISCIISIIFSINFFDSLIYFRWLLILINFSKYILLAAFVYKCISLKTILISLIIQFIGSLTASELMIFTHTELMNKKQLLNVVILLFVRLSMMVFIFILNKKTDYYSAQTIPRLIPIHIYALILLSLFLLSGLIQTANFLTENISVKLQLLKILAVMIAICWGAIIISLIFNVISKKYQSDINSMLKQQVNSQLYHYNQLEKINTEIRSFKHDYVNHLKCIRSMLSNKEYDDLQDYLNSLSSSFPTSSFIYETGNFIADAILTEKQVNTPDDISITFDGVIPTNIDNTDLCIILSNALDNAIEACCSCDNDKTINVYSGYKHGYFILKIKNPTVNNFAGDKMSTTKADKINHGFGLANIKRAVQKYSGYVSTSCEDNVFTLNITFMNFSNDFN